jgi:hypothetical protein
MIVRMEYFGVASDEAAPDIADMLSVVPDLEATQAPTPPGANPPFGEFGAVLLLLEDPYFQSFAGGILGAAGGNLYCRFERGLSSLRAPNRSGPVHAVAVA